MSQIKVSALLSLRSLMAIQRSFSISGSEDVGRRLLPLF